MHFQIIFFTLVIYASLQVYAKPLLEEKPVEILDKNIELKSTLNGILEPKEQKDEPSSDDRKELSPAPEISVEAKEELHPEILDIFDEFPTKADVYDDYPIENGDHVLQELFEH